jgi:large subunit ribosomal protein L10
MDNPRPEKVAVVDEVRERFIESDAVILTEYRGLKVKELATLRRSLTPAGGDYKVYKNTLVRFAARDAGLAGLDSLLEGPTAVAFVKGDAAAVAKTLRDFSRTQPLLVIKGGVLGNKVLNVAETTALADLPSREVLLARFAGALAAPLQQMAGLLQALPRNFAYGLKALVEQKVAAGESLPAPAADAAPADAPADEVVADAAPVNEVVADAPADAEVAEAPADAAAEAPVTDAAADAPAEAAVEAEPVADEATPPSPAEPDSAAEAEPAPAE